MSESQGVPAFDPRSPLSSVEWLLRRARLVTVVGPAGAGKSAFARRAADRLGGRFSDGAALVDLSGTHDPELLPHTIAVALGVHDHTFHPVPVALVEYLRERYVLLVLDSCEQLPWQCAAVAEYLLAHAPGLQILAVSEAPLGVQGERVVGVRPPEVPASAVMAAEFQRAATAERDAWLRLSVLPGSFDRSTAEAVCGTPILPTVAEPVAAGRFRLPLPARRHAAAFGAAVAACDASAEHFAELAACFDASWFGPDQPAWMARLDVERENLRAMLRHLLAEPTGAVVAARAALDLRHAWLAAGTLAEGRHWLERALERVTPSSGRAPSALELVLAARLRLVSGRLAVAQRDIPAAMVLLTSARDAFIAACDPIGYALALSTLGGAALGTDQHVLALRYLDDGVERLETHDADACLARIDHAETLLALGQVERARSLAAAVVGVCEQRGDVWVRGSALLTVGRAAIADGDVGAVRGTAADALRCQRLVGAVPGMSVSFTMLGLAAASDGDLERAAVLYGAAYRARSASGLAGALPVRVGSDLDELEAAVEVVRGVLGERASQAAFRRGAALRIGDAAQLALGETSLAGAPVREASSMGEASARPSRIAEPGSAA